MDNENNNFSGNYSQSEQNSYYYQQPQQSNNQGSSGMAIASLVLGIVSLTICCIIGWLPGLIGLILAIVVLVKKKNGKGLAIGGLVTSILGILVGIYMLVSIIIGYATAGAMMNDSEFQKQFWDTFNKMYQQRTGEEFDFNSLEDNNFEDFQ